jgi:hypothetical protein
MRVFAAAAVLMLVLAVPSWAAQPRRASLKLASVAPLVVGGTGFGAGEHVTVIAAVPGNQQIIEVDARRSGRFAARFTLRLERCSPLTVRAIGALGSRAILQVKPACARNKRNNTPPTEG